MTNFRLWWWQELLANVTAVFLNHIGRNMQVVVADPSEVRALIEIFILGTYQWAFRGPVQTIVDAGAHIGGTALWFAARYPHARIIAVEPHPDTFTRLRDNTRARNHA